MLTYVGVCLERIKALGDEYELCRQQVAAGRIELRACQADLDQRERERASLLLLLEAWRDSTYIAFEERDRFESACASLRKMRSASYAT